MQLTLSGVMNVAQLVAVIPPVYFLDVIGRRLPLMIGSTGMAISHFVVAAMIGQYGHDWEAHGAQAWVGVAFIIFFMIPFGISWGPVPWSLREYPPQP
jgi:Na+-driven multidrug efflux pump